MTSTRSSVISLYKRLVHLGREYPEKPEELLRKIHNAFMRNRDLTDPKEIQQCLEKGDYIAKELEALYMLRKYRTMKSRYYD